MSLVQIPGAQAVGAVVGFFGDLVQAAERLRDHDRAEDLLADDPHVGPGVGDDRGLDEVAGVAEAPPPVTVVAPSASPDSRNPVTRCSCSSETSGPIWVPESMPGPSLMPLAISATPLTTSSNRSSWTNRREPATQHWPWLKKIALAAPSTAPASASSNTMLGLLPPSSRVSFFRLLAPEASTISLPHSVEPVKATLSTSSWAARAAPAVSPKPVTTFTTPSGMPASAISWASSSAVSGVCSAGLSTMQLPVVRAGPSFHAAISSGKFHGMICPTTPSGSRSV